MKYACSYRCVCKLQMNLYLRIAIGRYMHACSRCACEHLHILHACSRCTCDTHATTPPCICKHMNSHIASAWRSLLSVTIFVCAIDSLGKTQKGQKTWTGKGNAKDSPKWKWKANNEHLKENWKDNNYMIEIVCNVQSCAAQRLTCAACVSHQTRNITLG